MIDIKQLREDTEGVARALNTRGFELDVELFVDLDDKRKLLQVDTEHLQSQRKNLSNDFGKLKSQGGDTTDLKLHIDSINSDLKTKEAALQLIQNKLNDFLLNQTLHQRQCFLQKCRVLSTEAEPTTHAGCSESVCR